ncbi:MAG TPA: Tm-1-like ATP-binding domain-containing protein, partial [Kouleothrix sp.]|nr:Tm-1-like ATP-binding domain-containing protein [Kouleothrix sp.]HRC76634.1 Tm-1-like ATP-binding domain-containing protein [Kouleothrix sp.]
MTKPIAIIGALDTKGAEFAYLRERIQSYGAPTLTIDIGVVGAPPFAPDIASAAVAQAAGTSLGELRAANDR